MLISILSALPTPTGCILTVWLVEPLIQEWGTFQSGLVLAGVCRLEEEVLMWEKAPVHHLPLEVVNQGQR